MLTLPPLPDQATLEMMALWAAAGATTGFGSVFARWLLKPGVFGNIEYEPPLHIPGAPQPESPLPRPWSMAGARAAAAGAAVGALMAWGWYGPEDTQVRLGVLLALAGLARSLWYVVHTLRDVPAIGEPPPDDPDKTVAARMPGALGGAVMAALGLAMAFL